MLRRQRNLVKIMYKTSKYDVNVQHDHPSMDLRSKPKVKLKNKFTNITKVYNSPLYLGTNYLLPYKMKKTESNSKWTLTNTNGMHNYLYV